VRRRLPPAPAHRGRHCQQKEGEALTITSTAVEHASGHTNLVCLSCGHIQPVQRDQLPSRCEHCRESFTGCGYLLDDASDADELSQEVLDSKSISNANGVRT
jgi:hypothetical protein